MKNSTTEPFNTANSNAMLGAVRFRSHEAQKVNNLFEKYFGVKFQSFWIGWVVGFDNQILIDLQKFEKYLNQKYNYKGSLSDFVFKKFGGEAHEFLKKLI